MERTMLSKCGKLGCEMNSGRLKFSNPSSPPERKRDKMVLSTGVKL